MNRNRLGLASAVVVLLFLAASIWVAGSLPDDVRLPTHWGLDGRPDSFSGKWPGLLMPPLLTAFVSLLFWFLPALEPRGRNFTRSSGLYLWSWAALLLVMAAIELVILSIPLHWHLRVEHVMTGAIGLMFLLIGNQLGKSRSMYMVGIRTPWTLASEEVWIKTHRLGGKLMVSGGALMVAASFLPIPSGLLATVYGLLIAVMVGVPIVYSYVIWWRERAQPSE